MDLSVIIPACGVQRSLAACLRSVTRCPRDNMDMECIVVNNDRAGETAAVVNRYMERDSRIKLVFMEEWETSDAHNIGIEKASGRYILFLDAADRLCEDAWEQIEAAVGEEYADFTAFSYISSRENGKLRAQMLPISDVISTDEREARRLMYADSVLNTCAGKLFKSRIIRDNHIFFRTDLMTAPAFREELQLSERFRAVADFVFVAEYFEHSESYLLTKAMILYCPPGGKNILKNYSIEDRVEFIRILYDFHVSAVEQYNEKELTKAMKIYFLEMLSDLFGEYVKERCYRKDVVDTLYESVLGNEFLKKFLDEMDEQAIHSRRGRCEYRLLREGNAAKIRRYFAVRTGNVAKIRKYF